MKRAYNNLEMVVPFTEDQNNKREMILQFMSLFVPRGLLESTYK